MSQIAKRMMITVGICALVLSVLSLPFGQYIKPLPFSLGVVMGCAVNILKIYMLERAVIKCTEENTEKKDASIYLRFQNFLRLMVTGAVLTAAALMPNRETLWGGVAGVLTMQIAAWSAKNIQDSVK